MLMSIKHLSNAVYLTLMGCWDICLLSLLKTLPCPSCFEFTCHKALEHKAMTLVMDQVIVKFLWTLLPFLLVWQHHAEGVVCARTVWNYVVHLSDVNTDTQYCHPRGLRIQKLSWDLWHLKHICHPIWGDLNSKHIFKLFSSATGLETRF